MAHPHQGPDDIGQIILLGPDRGDYDGHACKRWRNGKNHIDGQHAHASTTKSPGRLRPAKILYLSWYSALGPTPKRLCRPRTSRERVSAPAHRSLMEPPPYVTQCSTLLDPVPPRHAGLAVGRHNKASGQ